MQPQYPGMNAPATIDMSQQMNADPNFAPSQTMAAQWIQFKWQQPPWYKLPWL